MKEHKIIDESGISFNNSDHLKLNYQMIFNEDETTTAEINKPVIPQLSEEEKDRRWRNKIKTAKAKAYAAGHEKGWQEGLEEGRTQISEHLDSLRAVLECGYKEWMNRQRLLNPGILELVFTLTEKIVEDTSIHADMREHLTTNLAPVLQKLDEECRPVLLVSEGDLDHIKSLEKDYMHKSFLKIKTDAQLKPGEFQLQTDQQDVSCIYKEILNSFRDNLSLPSWD